MTKICGYQEQLAAFAADTTSGSTDLARRAAVLLRRVLAEGRDAVDLARALCAAQPGMASVLAVARAAEHGGATALDALERRLDRAPDALARFAAGLVGTRVVTLSNSGTVAAVLERVHARAAPAEPLQVHCGEGRPMFEGRIMATRLAAAGLRVTVWTDAALAGALSGSDSVLVGADAVTADWFLNKCGTEMLLAAAARRGVPAYLVASRDKLVPADDGPALHLRDGAPAEVWTAPPAAIAIRNPYFERVPTELLAGAITDLGVLHGRMLADACESAARAFAPIPPRDRLP